MCVRGGVTAKSSWALITLHGPGAHPGGWATEGGRHKERETDRQRRPPITLIRHGGLDGTERWVHLRPPGPLNPGRCLISVRGDPVDAGTVLHLPVPYKEVHQKKLYD